MKGSEAKSTALLDGRGPDDPLCLQFMCTVQRVVGVLIINMYGYKSVYYLSFCAQIIRYSYDASLSSWCFCYVENYPMPSLLTAVH